MTYRLTRQRGSHVFYWDKGVSGRTNRSVSPSRSQSFVTCPPRAPLMLRRSSFEPKLVSGGWLASTGPSRPSQASSQSSSAVQRDVMDTRPSGLANFEVTDDTGQLVLRLPFSQLLNGR